MNENTFLILGYGNPGRGDDGLGPAFAESIENLDIDGVHVEVNYQLTVEDAAAIAEYVVVVFVDATMQGPAPFRLERIQPDFSMSFSSHHIEPPALLALARGLFDAKADAFVLAIRGYEFDELSEFLSESARSNLDAALEYLVPPLKRGLLRKEPSETASRDSRTKSFEARSNHVN